MSKKKKKPKKSNKAATTRVGGVCNFVGCLELSASRNAFLCKTHGKVYATLGRDNPTSKLAAVQKQWLLDFIDAN